MDELMAWKNTVIHDLVADEPMRLLRYLDEENNGGE